MTNKNNYSKIFKTLDSVFITLLTSQIILCITFYFIKTNNLIENIFLSSDYVKISIVILNFSSIFIAKFIYSLSVKRIASTDSLDEKVNKFRIFSIIRLAILESVNMINLIAFLVVGENIFLLIFAIMLALFFIYRPLPQNFIRDFNLSESEKNIILNNTD